MVIESKTLSQEMKNQYPILKYMFKVIKQLLMNEIEICYWSIYLDRFSWHSDLLNFEDNLLIVALVAKVNFQKIILDVS
jgi:hypothetical protein